MYHRVANSEFDPWKLCVSEENFHAQLVAITKAATTMGISDYVEANKAGYPLPKRIAVVTFDDGYVDNLHTALPLLARHKVPATFYITTGYVGSPREFWWDWLETLLIVPNELPAVLELHLPDCKREWKLGDARIYNHFARAADWDVNPWSAPVGTRLNFFYDVWKTLWPLQDKFRWSVLQDIADWSGHPEPT
ncbi:polysaccharide deacetylase family protein, partial [Aphanothece microscopica]